MLRCGNLNGNNITYDNDITNLIYWIFNQGVLTGMNVYSGNVNTGKAILYATRTNGEIVAVAVENTTPFAIDTTGTKKVYLTINQAKLDDGSENNVDGTEIVTIATGANYPASNCVKLASISGGTITDEREYVSFKPNRVNGNLNFVNNGVPLLNNIGLNIANGLVKLNSSGKIDSSFFDVSLNIGALTENTSPTGSFFGIFYNGTNNLKISLLNLIKGLLPTNLTENTAPTTSFIVTLFNGSGNVKTTLANLVKGLGYATTTTQGVVYIATDAEAASGTSNTIAITPKQVKDNYFKKYELLQTNGSNVTYSAFSTGNNSGTVIGYDLQTGGETRFTQVFKVRGGGFSIGNIRLVYEVTASASGNIMFYGSVNRIRAGSRINDGGNDHTVVGQANVGLGVYDMLSTNFDGIGTLNDGDILVVTFTRYGVAVGDTYNQSIFAKEIILS